MSMTAVLGNAGSVPVAAASQTAAFEHLTPPELLEMGKFALYHLAKAKLALENNDIPGAYYQIRASLAHDRLPEAVAMKRDLKKRLKAA